VHNIILLNWSAVVKRWAGFKMYVVLIVSLLVLCILRNPIVYQPNLNTPHRSQTIVDKLICITVLFSSLICLDVCMNYIIVLYYNISCHLMNYDF
jgi:hypothetical protein